MNVEKSIRTSLIWSPGFNWSRLTWQYAAPEADIHRPKPGFQYVTYPDYFLIPWLFGLWTDYGIRRNTR